MLQPRSLGFSSYHPLVRPGGGKMRDPGNEDPRAPPVNCLFGEERAPGSKVRWKIEPVIASKTAIALYKNLI